MADLASCFTDTLALSPSLRNDTVPLVSEVELAPATVMVTVASPSPELGDTEIPVPLALAVHG